MNIKFMLRELPNNPLRRRMFFRPCRRKFAFRSKPGACAVPEWADDTCSPPHIQAAIRDSPGQKGKVLACRFVIQATFAAAQRAAYRNILFLMQIPLL
jgi:hypothetical protein